MHIKLSIKISVQNNKNLGQVRAVFKTISIFICLVNEYQSSEFTAPRILLNAIKQNKWQKWSAILSATVKLSTIIIIATEDNYRSWKRCEKTDC